MAHLLEIFAEVHRVPRPDGTLWLNLGDCYATGAGPVGDHPGGGVQGQAWKGQGPNQQPNRMPQPGLKPKDLVGMPWRVAFALQAWGWWLRRDIIWAKGMSFCPAYSGSVMPESVKDRPTSSHEYLFLLTKQETYFYDHAAIREPAIYADEARYDPGTNGHEGGVSHKGSGASTRRFSPRPGTRAMPPQPGEANAFHEVGRNVRSVWAITTHPFPDAHFATFPEALVEPCVLAGSPPGGLVLDPFSGSGTVALVCQRLGRRVVGLELSEAYCRMAYRRSAQLGLV